jgi:perosamine synthetase
MKFLIPIFKLKFSVLFKIRFLARAWDILSSGRPIGESKYVNLFEKKFSEIVKSKYAISCTNGTSAIELALKAIDVRNKNVVCPSNTFFATSVAIENAGGNIILSDCELSTFSLCYKSLKEILDNNEVTAVVIVHIGGLISKDIDKIVKLCQSKRVALIEDAAHAHGSNFNNYYAGSIGDIGCFSFFPTKVMTTGEGGMITTNDTKYYEKIKSLKNFGRDNEDQGSIKNAYGNNFKINELTGLMGLLECGRVFSRIDKRNALVKRYVENLKNSKYKVLVQEEGLCSHYKCILMSQYSSNKLTAYCASHGVNLTGQVYKTPVHQQVLYLNRFNLGNLKNTEFVTDRHICPPLYPELTLREVDYICKILKKYEE